MATPETTNPVRPGKVVAKGQPVRRERTPSSSPVLLFSLAVAIILHLLLCIGMQAYVDQIQWRPFAIDSIAMIPNGDGSLNQFFINPIVSFLPFDILFGFIGGVMISFMIRVPYYKHAVHETVKDLKKRLMMQLTMTGDEIESIIKNDPASNKRILERRDDINIDSVQSEIDAINAAQAYLSGKGSWSQGINTYMRFHFVEKFSNRVTGAAYGGAAFLILVVGIRGLKFIPSNKPSFLIFALGVEFSMLTMLAITMIFTDEEERTDRILRQMVDAVKGGKKKGVELVAEPEPQVPQISREEYEALVRQEMDKKIAEIMRTKDDDAVRRIALDLVASSGKS